MRLVVFLLLTLNSISYADQAVFAYANPTKVLDSCQNYVQKKGSAYDYVGCSLYVAGVIDELQNSISLTTVDTDCYAKNYPGVSIDQIIRMYVKYLENHPEKLNVAAAAIISDLYLQSFPIPKECFIQQKQESFIDRMLDKIKK